MIFVFIGGASGSGKTTLSSHLLTELIASGISAQKLNMDDYFQERPDGEDPEEYRLTTNFDTPDMLHLELLAQHLIQLSEGKIITKPLFSFQSNRREGEEIINPSDVIIVEGIFGQYFYKRFIPAEFSAISVNVATESYLDILKRRIDRDIAERGRIKDAVIQHEKKFVGAGFFKYTASSSVGSDIYIVNKYEAPDQQHISLGEAIDEIIKEINSKMLSATKGRTLSIKAHEMMAQSHLIAYKRPFEGYFSGLFGEFEGVYRQELSEQSESSHLNTP